MNLRAVLFDIGGTLIDYPSLDTFENVCEKRWRDIIGPHPEILMRMHEIYKQERETSFQSLREAILSIFLDKALKESRLFLDSKDRETILRKFYYFSMQKHARPYKGAAKLLKAIKNKDLKIGLISNTPFAGEYHEEDLKRFRIFSYFDIRIWSSEFGLRKPHPAIFYKALQLLKVVPREAIYIGDKFSRDVEGPNRVGMRAILINQKGEKKEFFGWQVNELNEILKIIKKDPL